MPQILNQKPIPDQNPNERLMQYLQSLQYGAFEKPAAPMDLSAYDRASAAQQQAPAPQLEEASGGNNLGQILANDTGIQKVLMDLGAFAQRNPKAINLISQMLPAPSLSYDQVNNYSDQIKSLFNYADQLKQKSPTNLPKQSAQSAESIPEQKTVDMFPELTINPQARMDFSPFVDKLLNGVSAPVAAPNVDMSTVNAATTVGNTLVPRKENLSLDAAAQQAKAAFVPVGSVAKPYEMPSGFMAKVGKFFAPLGYEQQRLMNQAANDAHEQFKLNPTPESQATWDAARAQLGNIGHEVNANNQARIAAYQQLMAQQTARDRLAQAELLAADRLAAQMEIEQVRQANMNKRAEDKAKNDMSWIEKAYPVKSAPEAKAVDKVSEKNRIKIKKID